MIKNVAFRIIRSKIRRTLPLLNPAVYNKLFNSTYRFFLTLKPSQIWVIVLALLNKVDLKTLLNLPSIFLLFNSIFSDSDEVIQNSRKLTSKINESGLENKENELNTFFWVIITLAIMKRFINTFFRLLWIPFKIALIYYILKYFGFEIYWSYWYGVLNTLSLGIIEWFHDKITDFVELLKKNY